jgi:hypothetical protein
MPQEGESGSKFPFMLLVFCCCSGRLAYAVQIAAGHKSIGDGLLSAGSIIMRHVDVLDSVTVGRHVLVLSRPVPVLSQNGLENVWIGAGGNTIQRVVRAHD